MTEVIEGVDGLHRGLGRLFLTIGVFDGLHRGHAYLLAHLVKEAGRRAARPAVITFDAHPDEILVGKAPPLLLDPDERLARLADAGIEVTVVQHFDEAVRRTPFDAFVRAIRERVDLAGFLMTPDSAFGHERRGTADAVRELGATLGFDVAVVPPLSVEGRAVSSSEIRRRITAGDLHGAAELLGRPYAITGAVGDDGRLAVPMPVALPPDGSYPAEESTLIVEGGAVRVEPAGVPGRRRVAFD